MQNHRTKIANPDGTVWSPDMYELWGGGAPFKKSKNGKDLIDCRGTNVRLLGIVDRILHDLRNDNKFKSLTKVAWVSCTDEPLWANECLEKFLTFPGGEPLKLCADSSQIFKANKQVHFRKLKEQYPTIEFQDMLFFDNEYGNIQSVSKLGVKCIYCPSGMTQDVWEEGLRHFDES
mmetsp:Transcript_22256/g.30492  ORF Transcript_22256/g.30492 Transcript_22256/m.30492 type:complete len:176 (+) Transcript_22256:163-690(+)